MIKPAGWHNWSKQSNEKTAYYAEYKNSGPGYKPSERVGWAHQLDETALKDYSLPKILKGWDPEEKH